MANNLFAYEPTREEQRFLRKARQLFQEHILPARAELDRANQSPDAIFQVFREAGLFPAMFPREVGGSGFHPMVPMLLMETMAEYCLGIATCFGVTTALAPLPLMLDGAEDQKRRFLPSLVSGKWLGAFAMTELEAGSDLSAIATRAEKVGDHYILNGEKKWITNAGFADLYFIFAVTDPTRGVTGGLSCFVVEKERDGLSFGALEDKMGIRCVPNRPILLENVKLPVANLVGMTPNRGFLLAMKTLAKSRCKVAATAVGLAQAAYQEAAKYTRGRRQFGKRVIDFQAVQHMLAEMAVRIETGRLLAHKAAWQVEALAHRKAMKLAAMAKLYCSEMAMRVATDALQLHGGYGFVKDNPIEKMFRDAKILAIYEGTSQLLKNQIGADIIAESAGFAAEEKRGSSKH